MRANKKLYSQVHKKPGGGPVTPPPGGGGGGAQVAPAVRTHYANDPLGSGLDVLWRPNGKHTAGQGTIDIVDDPLGIKGHVQKHTVHTGDIFSGGDRCEVLTDQIGGGEGDRFQIRFGLYLPPNFYSDGGTWNSLWDMHYPNNGPKQSPLGCNIINSNQLHMRVIGGPLSSDGTIGTIRHEGILATLTKGVWNEFMYDIYLHQTNGIADLWLNGSKLTTWGRIPTISPSLYNTTYWKQGFYRPQNSPAGTQSYFFTDTLSWKDSSPDNMLNWIWTP